MQQIFLDLFSNLFLFNLIINEIFLFSMQIQLNFKVLNFFVLFKIILVYAIYVYCLLFSYTIWLCNSNGGSLFKISENYYLYEIFV